MAVEMDWHGKSGKSYRYWGYPINEPFVAKPGNYIFAKSLQQNSWTPVYIGECEDLSTRCTPSHHKWNCTRQNGATHIFAHISSENRDARLQEETDLRNRFNTVCNEQ